ncbi:hypothetical protein Pcinc_024133 [Petrolisthes cinctipes]|uniref:Uncharacterized protein n=1 Tax=Petrolisthes cinctipes TaxID=88211 RepID=A0AAE1FC60_PETCI|nr:hypothetical protein Pcinc_024133 [Petrolisthes cinctipes]
MIQKVQNTVGAELRKNRGASFCKICSAFLTHHKNIQPLLKLLLLEELNHLNFIVPIAAFTFQILIENQLVRRLAEKDYSAGIEGYWYQYFKRVCSMKEMIIHQKWYKMLLLMHKKMPEVMHMKHKRVYSTKEMIIHQKWYLMRQSSQHKKIPQMHIIFSQLQYADRAVFVFPDMMS